MNPYVIKTECDVCGGPAYARPRDEAKRWTGGLLRHVDPEECAAVVAALRRQLEGAQDRPVDLQTGPQKSPRGDHHE